MEPDDDPEAAEARLRRQVQLGDVAALVPRGRAGRQQAPGAGHRRRPARAPLVDRPVGPRRHRLRQGDRQQRPDQLPADGAPAGEVVRVEDPDSGATRSSATGPGPTSRPTRPAARCTSSRRRWPRSAPATPRRGTSSRCRTRRSASASPRPCAASCRITWSSAAGRSRTITRTRRRRGTPTRATSSGPPGRTRTPSRASRSSRRTIGRNFKGIDIMRTVRSFDPCLPCGVHMYDGGGAGPGAAPLAGDDSSRRDGRGPSRAGGQPPAPRPARRPTPPGRTGVEEPLDARRVAERVGALLAELGGIADPRLAERSRTSSALLMQFYGAGLRADARDRPTRPAPSTGRCSTGSLADELVSQHPDPPRPPPARPRDAGPGGPRPGPPVPRLARRRRRDRRDRRRRRPAPDGGQLLELPVVDGDPELRDREGDPRGGARRSPGSRRRGSEAPPTGPLIQLEPRGGADGRAGGAPNGRRDRQHATWPTLGPGSSMAPRSTLCGVGASAGCPAVILCRAGDDLYAYRDRCPNCRSALAERPAAPTRS